MVEAAVVGFARRHLDPVLGGGSVASCSLAGGAFKSLLHGRPPRDLDLWPATEADRERLAARLLLRGARLERHNPPFQSIYTLGDMRVELAHDTSAATLKARLGRFDLGLSAVGAEHRGGARRGAVHPLVLESLRRREALRYRTFRSLRVDLRHG